MRTSNTIKKRTLAKLAGLIVIALCFALTFTLTLTLDFKGASNDTMNSVADAKNADEIIKDQNGEVLWGSPTPISIASYANINGQDVFGSDTTSQSWTYYINLNSVVPSETGGNPTNHQLWKAGGKTDLVTKIGTANSWLVGIDDAAEDSQFAFSMSYMLPSFISTLIENPNFTVKFTVSMNYNGKEDGNFKNGVFYQAYGCTRDTVKTAKESFRTSTDAYTKHHSNPDTSALLTFNTLTLSSGQDCIGIGLAFEPNWRVSAKRRVIKFSNIRIQLDISLNSSWTDGSGTIINDGSAPVKVAETLMHNNSAVWSDSNGFSKVGTRVVEQYSPFITNVADMPVYYAAIANQLASYTDKRPNVAGSNTDAVLNSFKSSSSYVPGATSYSYRKSASIEFADTFNYKGVGSSEKFDPSKGSASYMAYAGIAGYAVSGSKWIVDSNPTQKSRNERMASGIKTVTVNVTPNNFQSDASHTFNVYSFSSSQMWRIEADGQYVGYVKVTKNSRSNVSVDLYLNRNASVTIDVRDYGGSVNTEGVFEPSEGCTSTTEFRGIDWTAPTAANCNGETKLESDYVADYQFWVESTDPNEKKKGFNFWYKADLFESEASSGEDKDEESAPHIWFYSVKKADSLDALKALTPQTFTGYSTIKSRGMLPIGYGTLSSFKYNFEGGYAVVDGVGTSQYTVNNVSSIGAQTGVGYYMFTFYKCDIAGNLGETVTEYVRADYIQPEYELDFSYTVPGQSEPIKIDNLYDALENMKWALGESTLKINITDVNFSGNTLRFEDTDNEYMLTIDREGNIALYNNKNQILPVDGRLELRIATYLESTKIYIEYSVNEVEYNGEVTHNGVLTITFEGNDNADQRFPTVAWMTGFGLYTVAYADMKDMDGDENLLFAVTRPEAKILIDRHDPSMPELQDEENSYIVQNKDYTIDFANKVWKTDNYLLDSTLLFEDFAADIDLFAPYVNIYMGFKFINSAEDFKALEGLVEARYKNIKSIADATADNLLDKCIITPMSQLTNGSSAFPIEFFQAKGSGMRVLYTWAVDQSGRVSELYSCYVLIDTTVYNVSSQMLEAIIGDKNYGANGKIVQTDEDDVTVSRFKRGETIKFDVTVADGYVPYLFRKSGSISSDMFDLLTNYSPNKTMVKVGSAFDQFVTFDYGEKDNAYVMTFKLDDNDNLGALNSDVSFTMSARKVVKKNPKYNKYYDARQLDMKTQVVLTDINDTVITDATEYLEFEYFTSYDISANDGDKLEQAPTDVGTYHIRIFIPQDNAAFVMELTENEIATGKIIPIQFTILKGRVVITPNVTTSMYGAIIELKANISGFDFEGGVAPTGERLVGSLKLNVSDWAPNAMLNVGEYRITYDTLFEILDAREQPSPNFDVVFVENVIHTITQRRVNISVWNERKQYGDVDPVIRFAVDSAQFDWYTGSIENLLQTIFGSNYNRMDAENMPEGVYLYDSNGRITRAKGENAGKYDYIAPSSGAFDVNSNYTLTLTIGEGSCFVIDKRNVNINAKGQSSVIKYGQPAPAPDTLHVEYTLASKDVLFADDIARAVAGLLRLGEPGALVPEVGYDGKYVYSVILGQPEDNNVISTENFIITLVADNYIVYVTEQGTVILKLKDGAVFEFVYGQLLTNNLINYRNFADKFEVVTEDGEAVDFDDVRWDFSFGDVQLNQYIPVGSHYVNIFNASLLKNGAVVSEKVKVDSFTATVNPAEIVVRPISRYKAKTYGQEESYFSFGFEIVSVNGNAFNTSSTYAGLSYANLKNGISGVYGRGRYTVDGELRHPGERFDDATDANGVILAGYEGDYYGYIVSTAFAYTENNNFTVNAEIDDTVRFVINPSIINLDVKNFVGINKTYDGNTSVSYGSSIAYDISGQLKRASDNLKLAFDAEYDNIGVMNTKTEAGIIFTYLRLEGSAAHNYVLGRITNVNENIATKNELFDGENKVSAADISDSVKLVIYYIDNIYYNQHIYIMMGQIAILKSDFTVTKTYDGTKSLLKQDVSIAERRDEFGGSAMLHQIWGQSNATISSATMFESANAGDYMLNIVLRFDIPGIQEGDITINNTGAYYDPDIKIEIIPGVAFSVRINSIPASITKKVLGVESFEEIRPVDQDYSGQSGQGVIKKTEIMLKDGVIVDGDVAEVKLVSVINDGNFNAGRHTICFAEMGSDKNHSSINNANYTIDIAALNEHYSEANALKVNINKAKLLPNIQFVDKSYDGSTEVKTQSVNSDLRTDFITENFAAELVSELERLHLSGTVKYALSANGVENANVVTDKNGNVIAHNVLVSGVTITSDDAGLLDNYDMAGGRYNKDTKQYETVAATANTIIEPYEIIGAVNVSRTTLKLLSNNVIIKDKVYDSTREADITISLENSGVVSNGQIDESKYLYVTATGMFTKNYVSENLPVVISDVQLVAKDGYEYLLNNYLLPYFSERRNASILPRPVAVTADLGVKTYNGSAAINVNALNLSLGEMIGNEKDGYAVQATPGYAYYIDKNVNVIKNGDGIVTGIGNKEGALYNPILRNNRGKVNYELVIAKEQKDGENYIAYVDVNGALHYGEKLNGEGTGVLYYYYSLPTADKYIEIADSNSAAIESARNAGAIAGNYVLNGKNVYAIDSEYAGTVTGEMTALHYLKGEGRINQKAVSISTDGITVNNQSAFTKMYDGTTHFLGKPDTGDGTGDYTYRDGGISGVVEGDDVKVTAIHAEYDTAYTTANYVVFTPDGISGKDVDNYRIDGKIGSARIMAQITKRTIDAELKNGTVEYGTAINNIVGEIEYKAHGNVTAANLTGMYGLIEWEKNLYLQLSQYTDMMGFDIGNYQDALMSRIYTINMNGNVLNGFDKFEDAELGSDRTKYYIRLSGISSLPTAKANFALSNPVAGQSTLSYTLVNVNVNNYAFNPVYKDADGKDATTAELKVVPRDIFVTATRSQYTKYYAGNEPLVELFYLNEKGLVGLAPGENENIVFKRGDTDYSPVVKWGVYNKTTGTWTEAGKYAVISEDLGSDEVYLAKFFAPDGVDYKTFAPNYNINLGVGFVIDSETGNIQIVYGNDASGVSYTFKSAASTLNLEQPGMGGVSLRGAQDNKYTYTYNGKNLVSNVLYGATSADTVTLGEYDSVVNFGTYTGKVSVKRPVKIDETDTNGYFNIWTSEEEITIDVLKASPQLIVETTSKYYDGNKFEYKISGTDNMISYLPDVGITVRDGYADIRYEVLNEDKYEAVSEMRDAGTYRVIVALNDEFANNNPNYAAEQAVAVYTILRATVNVTISAEGYTEGKPSGSGKTLVTTYDANKTGYVIGYTIANMPELPEALHLALSQTELKFESEINSAGRYPFRVQITDGERNKNNYRLVNEGGVLELTTKNVASNNASVALDTEAVVNRLVAKELTQGKGGGFDIELWSSINSHMPLIDKNASLASVVRLELYCNDVYVEYTEGNIDVSVKIPSNVGDLNGKAVYTVTKDGALKRLDNYTVNNGKIEYTTDYLGALVFVDLTVNAMPAWQIALIVVGVLLVVITAVWTGVALAIRKSRLKKIA